MKAHALAVFAFMALVAAAPSTAPQPAARIDITKVTCSDLLKSSPLDRSAVVMFYWGYAAAKAGVSSFKTNVLETATEHLTTLCAKHPSETMIDAMHDVDIKAF
jgi:hypothetical protein